MRRISRNKLELLSLPFPARDGQGVFAIREIRAARDQGFHAIDFQRWRDRMLSIVDRLTPNLRAISLLLPLESRIAITSDGISFALPFFTPAFMPFSRPLETASFALSDTVPRKRWSGFTHGGVSTSHRNVHVVISPASLEMHPVLAVSVSATPPPALGFKDRYDFWRHPSVSCPERIMLAVEINRSSVRVHG